MLGARLISLAPSITETLAVLGACSQVIAAVGGDGVPHFCPKAAVLVSMDGLWNPEALRGYAPDRVLVWTEGSAQDLQVRLKSTGVKVELFSIEKLQDIPVMTVELAALSGARQRLPALNQLWQQRIEHIRSTYQYVPWMSVFYEVWPSPLMTLKEHHYIAQALALCHLQLLAPHTRLESPTVSWEWVIQKHPERVILPVGLPLQPDWSKADIPVRRVDTSELERPSPQMLDRLEHICQVIRSSW